MTPAQPRLGVGPTAGRGTLVPMGVLDKLMFWKKRADDLDHEVRGCFTLPADEAQRDEHDRARATVGDEPVTEDSSPEQC